MPSANDRTGDRSARGAQRRASVWRNPRTRRAILAVNLTPMIDVVFLLLIYFLMSAEFRRNESALTMQLPRAAEAAPPADPFSLPTRPVRLTVVTRGGGPDDAFIQPDAPALGEQLPLAQLESAIRSATVFPPDQRFIVVAGPGEMWEHTVRAIDALRAAGYDRITLAQPGANTESP
ncbi:MAG: biopolymer transporter ExbD [Planctomycetota bacterium]|nr:biopolymer transporter ExbD [Planctomycetota bacterium]